MAIRKAGLSTGTKDGSSEIFLVPKPVPVGPSASGGHSVEGHI